MAKKGQKQPGATTCPVPPNSIPNKDIFQRLSYQYQASALLAVALPTPGPTFRRSNSNKRRRTETPEKNVLIPVQPGSTHVEQYERMPVDGSVQEGQEEQLSDDGEHSSDSPYHPSSEFENTVQSKPNILSSSSKVLISTMRDAAKKATMRIDPSIKRTLCSSISCSAILIPGLTSKVRIQPSGPHAHLIETTCLNCGNKRKLPAPPWREDHDSVSGGDGDLGVVEATDALSEEGPGKGKKSRPKSFRTKNDKWKNKRKRQSRPPAFYERKGPNGHVTVVV
ncbi:Rpr2-domain-containing protein [Meredithblackwellia eburnea MCA 4105]